MVTEKVEHISLDRIDEADGSGRNFSATFASQRLRKTFLVMVNVARKIEMSEKIFFPKDLPADGGNFLPRLPHTNSVLEKKNG